MSKNREFLKKLGAGALCILTGTPRPIWSSCHYVLHSILHPKEKAKMRENLLPYFENRRGVCIGGALRWEFQDYVQSAAQVTNVDAVSSFFGRPTAADYLADATDLHFANDHEFDFLCSSHVLEHLANPIKALKEWKRVIKEEGIIYCGVPDKRFMFDHRRRRTTLRHLIEDYQSDIGPYDATHLWDIVHNSDVKMDSVDREQCFNRILEYVISGGAPSSAPHHHVYTEQDVVALFRYVGLEIIFVTSIRDTIHLVARKPRLRH